MDVLPFHIYYQMSRQRRVTLNLVIILLYQRKADNPRPDCCIRNNVHTNTEQRLKLKEESSPENRFTIKEKTS